MGMYTSAYSFFGAHVPDSQYEGNGDVEAELLDSVIGSFGSSPVGYILAGHLGQNELFLCVVPDGEGVSVDIGEWIVRTPDDDPETLSRWTASIRQVADAAGYTLGPIGWVTVADVS